MFWMIVEVALGVVVASVIYFFIFVGRIVSRGTRAQRLIDEHFDR